MSCSEGVLGHYRVDQHVPATTHRQLGDLGRPRADGPVGDAAALIATAERHPIGPLDEVGDVGRLLEQGGPDRLERRLGAHHREEPESLGVRVASEGVGGGAEACCVDGVQGFGVECVFGCKHGYVSFR